MSRTITRRLSAAGIKSAPKADTGDRDEYRDTDIGGLVLRVTDTGAKSFALYARFPPSGAPTRVKLGNVGKLSLAAARRKARDWLDQIEQGLDPREEDRKKQLAARVAKANTFSALAEDWLRERVAGKLVNEREAANAIRRLFVKEWKDKRVPEINSGDITAVISMLAETAPSQARNSLAFAKQMFRWAVAQGRYGIKHSPAADLRAGELVGKKVPRRRVLDDRELRAVWRAAEKTPYPYGPLFRFMILTGQRESECSDARWREFDTDQRRWIVPAERMKMATAHVVPLADDALALLASLPRFPGAKNDCLFSMPPAPKKPVQIGKRGKPKKERKRRITASPPKPIPVPGAKPVNSFGKAKQRLDEAVVAELSEPIRHFVLHDLRRTMRTNLSALAIEDRVREAMIAHAPPDMHKVYDQYSYLDEKRRGFELWEQRLRGIVDPPERGSNVVAFGGRGA